MIWDQHNQWKGLSVSWMIYAHIQETDCHRIVWMPYVHYEGRERDPDRQWSR